VRKSIRALVRLVLQYPMVFSPLQIPVGPSVRDIIGAGDYTTYGDLMLGSDDASEMFGFLLYSSEGAPVPGATSALWQLGYDDWAAMRSLVLLEATNVGGASRPAICGSCQLCPSVQFAAWDACTVKNKAAIGCSPAMVVSYAPATSQTTPQGTTLQGTFCNADTWMGDVHDKAVLVQQLLDQQTPPPPELVAMVVKGAQQINAFFQAIDLGRQIDLVMSGVCTQTLPSRSPKN